MAFIKTAYLYHIVAMATPCFVKKTFAKKKKKKQMSFSSDQAFKKITIIDTYIELLCCLSTIAIKWAP